MTDYVVVEGRSLAKAMKIVNAIIEKRNTIPILGCVKLTYDPAGLHIEGTNLDMEILVTVDEIEGNGEWSACLEAGTLAAIAAAAGPATMRIETTTREIEALKTRDRIIPATVLDGAKITIDEGAAVYDIDRTYPVSDWPGNLDRPRGELIERFTNGMLAATLEKVAWAISTEETRYYLNGVCWQTHGNGKRFAATDGHRLALCRYGGDGGDTTSRIIPRRAVAFMIQHFQGADVEIFSTADVNLIEIVSPAGRLRTKLIDGTFPDIDRVIPNRETINHSIGMKRDEIMTAIRQAMAVGGGDRNGPAIRFHGVEGRLNVERKNAHVGTAKVRTSTDWPDDAQAFGVNSRYMLEIVGKCQGAISLGVTDSGAPFLVGDDDDTMTRVIMPMRV